MTDTFNEIVEQHAKDGINNLKFILNTFDLEKPTDEQERELANKIEKLIELLQNMVDSKG